MLQRLTPEQWATSVGPDFPDWTVQDLAAHLAASEAVLATQLGVEPFTPERGPARRPGPTRRWPVTAR